MSSIPAPYGIGAFGKAARDWIDFLKKSGQRYWQILPLGPTSWGDSPYQSFSAFALSPYYIDLDALREAGLLKSGEYEGLPWGSDPCRTDYAALYQHREPVLRRAFSRFKGGEGYERFCDEAAHWLPDYSLFMALKRKMGDRSWLEWDEGLRTRNAEVLAKCEKELAEETGYHKFLQYLAFTQWKTVKQYANSNGVFIIGDMPIYVAMDSADAWAKGELFFLDENQRPLRVAGCPPDPFAGKGQLWGNPLYRWDVSAKTGFAWWIFRLSLNLSLYDMVRIDHFRGFESFYSIPADAPDASGGEWVKGPGLAFIEAVNRALPDANIIAEDLGYLTPEVKALLKASGYPGMKILQFAFDSREASDYMPHSYDRNCVVYTGTHDNDTTCGWFRSARQEDVALAREYLGLENDKNGAWAFIRAALSSVANLAVIPMQDYLGLGSEARMNAPSTLGGINWQWRMSGGMMTSALAERIRALTKITGRVC
jgi:4-alpha-glucanotransferase